jgi:hypothetical protein
MSNQISCHQNALFILKLRKNIALEGDLSLAKLELQAFFPDADLHATDVETISKNVPQINALHGFSALASHVRPNGKQAYTAHGPLSLFPLLICRISFIQRIYCLIEDSEDIRWMLKQHMNSLGAVITYHTQENYLVIQAIPHYTLIEISDVIASHSLNADDTKRNLTLTLEALLDKTSERHAIKLADTAISAQSTTSHLSTEAQVLTADTRHIPEDIGQFDILVTSPPYLPASSGRESYTKARAPSLIALGMRSHEDIDDLVDDTIGAMNGNRNDRDALTLAEREVVEWLELDALRAIKAEPVARYFLDMRQTFMEMYRVLQPGALGVVVSGKTSTFYQFSTREVLYVVNCAELLADEAERAGFIIENLQDIQLFKSNMNARPRSLDDYYETLILLRKPV